MGNCLSTCAKRSETEGLGQEIECNQIAETTQTNLATDSQVLGGEKVRDLVQQELQALQDQISHSQAVLAKLHFRFNDEQVSLSGDNNAELAKVHRTTQTSNPDTLPKSLECVSTSAGTKEWQETTASCPAIVNTGVQTDDDKIKSNNTSGEYFLPPISPLDSQSSEPPSPRDLDQVPTKPFEPKPLANVVDLEIYRSCRKLSVLPEEEAMGEETSPPSLLHRLAPAPLPHHQAHSFESYLLPVQTYPSVQRQLSDPTPSPRLHPQSRRTSRSTCRPLQLQPESNYFCFPDVLPDSPKRPALKSPPIVKFQDAADSAEDTDFFPRITSPTYNILQDTVSQLISMSSETLDETNIKTSSLKKESLTIPGCYTFSSDGSTPFKTPPEGSVFSTPGFYTPQEHLERKLPDSSTSSAFHTPTNVSPGANHADSKSNSNSSNSFKTPPVELPSEAPSDQSSFSTPMYMSPRNSKKSPSKNNNENTYTDVPDLKSIHTNNNLFVKPLPKETYFDKNRTMLSILLDEPRVQIDNSEESAMPFISFTSLDINPPAPVHSPPLDQVPSTSLSSPDASLSPLTPTEGLARTPSRRRLQRSLVRISSETPLELVPLESSVTLPPIDVPVPAIPPIQEPTIRENGIDIIKEDMEPTPQGQDLVQGPEGAKMRRTNSDSGSGLLGGAGSLPASNSFPSLSDTVLKQLGALMEEVKQQKEENQSSEKDVEGKFTSLMLAFKTDKLTLERRLELQMRLRDQAEHNMAEELNKLKAAVQLLSPLCTDSEKIELLEKVSEQVDALHKSTTRVSTSAEMHGAVQQENRLSKAVDIILRHVENLKQAYDKERTEHEDTRKILTDNKISPQAVLKLQGSKRRASIATLTRSQTPPDPSRSPLVGEGRGMSRARLGSLPRKLSSTILEADLEDTSSNKDPVSSNPGSSQSRESVESAGSSSPSPQTSLLQRKPSRPTLVENRRPSQSRDTESEDESTPLEPVRETEPPPSSEPCLALNINRRISIQAAWLSQISEHLEWAGPVDQMVTHMRYGVAAVLLVAALAVFTSTFILPHTRLGS